MHGAKAATVANATSGFRACGIYPYNPQAIPEHFFSISDASISAASANKALPSTSNHSNLTPGPNKAQPSTSFSPGHTNMGVSDMSTDSQTSNEASEVSLNLEEKETPSKFLREDNPIPLIPNTIPKRKQHALELTSPENRVKRRVFSEKKKQAQDKKDKRKKPSENEKKIRRKACVKQVKRKQNVSSSSSSETEPHFSSSEDLSDDTDDYCLECREYYYTTKSKVDWIQCEACSKWLHETCTNHTNMCNLCATKKR
ncbi:unnamed protein product [Acanthoscelides obtectus]|uniref:Phorbol-ester/DAG-type domain-containing protein n=1 Tax=Acanthoscelides obtectus TaxID=200917 RepID=A0A9P0KC91_ACAOB|nr:unnamed protein product [Acanthoscelides obtectus]CAK1680145.1 hypothetical protein AOBTE_LOCUS32519 [Acanthoscelides obtectus]